MQCDLVGKCIQVGHPCGKYLIPVQSKLWPKRNRPKQGGVSVHERRCKQRPNHFDGVFWRVCGHAQFSERPDSPSRGGCGCLTFRGPVCCLWSLKRCRGRNDGSIVLVTNPFNQQSRTVGSLIVQSKCGLCRVCRVTVCAGQAPRGYVTTGSKYKERRPIDLVLSCQMATQSFASNDVLTQWALKRFRRCLDLL